MTKPQTNTKHFTGRGDGILPLTAAQFSQQRTRRTFLKGAFWAAGALAANANAALNNNPNQKKPAQPPKTPSTPPKRLPPSIPRGWTNPEVTVTQLKQELKKTMSTAGRNDCLKTVDIEADLTGLDPILIGSNIVFSKKWLNQINANALTRSDFERWRDNADQVFNAGVRFIGQDAPKNGLKVFIDLAAASNFKKIPQSPYPYFLAHAHSHTNVICYNDTTLQDRFTQIKQSDCDCTMIHELGHIFANNRPWEAEPESWANLMVAYVLETAGIRYDEADARTQYRQRMFNEAQEKFEKARKVEVFAYEDGTAYDYYLFGLVDKVGWEAYRKAFRSYYDGSYTLKKYKVYQQSDRHNYKGDDKKVCARDFLDRIAYCSGQGEGVLRSLPDKGLLLDRYFNPPVARKQNPSKQLKRGNN
ncbi:MAG: hypothetical protein FWH21_03195 [Kiritimatiellaeota bacterium]|nr:hypothetical protein [Kiritimatiellota bacterium]